MLLFDSCVLVMSFVGSLTCSICLSAPVLLVGCAPAAQRASQHCTSHIKIPAAATNAPPSSSAQIAHGARTSVSIFCVFDFMQSACVMVVGGAEAAAGVACSFCSALPGTPGAVCVVLPAGALARVAPLLLPRDHKRASLGARLQLGTIAPFCCNAIEGEGSVCASAGACMPHGRVAVCCCCTELACGCCARACACSALGMQVGKLIVAQPRRHVRARLVHPQSNFQFFGNRSGGALLHLTVRHQ